jgi:hypothetical protein
MPLFEQREQAEINGRRTSTVTNGIYAFIPEEVETKDSFVVVGYHT